MQWRWYHNLALAAIILILVFILISSSLSSWPLVKTSPTSGLVVWYLMIGLLIMIVFVVGHGKTGRLLGALIDERNMMSLSRLQLVSWTIVILTAWLTAVLWNLVINKANPLAIALPTDVWLLLGISTTSLVGTPLILSNKTKPFANETEMLRQLTLKARQQGITGALDRRESSSSDPEPSEENSPSDPEPSFSQIERLQKDLGVVFHGQVPYNTGPERARLGDLFQSDEMGSYSQVDLSKVQLFFFTLILVLAYITMLGTMFASADAVKGITDFPALDQSMIILLGISHAGYLCFKAAPHSVQAGSPSS